MAWDIINLYVEQTNNVLTPGFTVEYVDDETGMVVKRPVSVTNPADSPTLQQDILDKVDVLAPGVRAEILASAAAKISYTTEQVRQALKTHFGI